MRFAYYNEIDPYAAQWLRNLIAAGHIADGEVDERSIEDVQADELREFAQCHFFAGIGGWSVGLRLAGWPDDRPVWTGSCPCQPFSAAGKGQAFEDKRHLWPSWFSLIEKRRPPTIFGEQVDAAIRWGWFDAVCNDLESVGYAIGAAVIPACGVGAPHIRQRLWFGGMADSNEFGSKRLRRAEGQPEQDERQKPIGRGEPSGMADSDKRGFEVLPPSWLHDTGQSGNNADGRGEPSGMADSDGRDAGAEWEQRSGQQRLQPEDGCTGILADSPDANGRTGIGATETGTRPDGVGRRGPSSGCIDGDMADSSSGGQRVVGDERQPGQGGHADGGFVPSDMGDSGSQGREGVQPEIPDGATWQERRSTSQPSRSFDFWGNSEFIPCTDGKARPIEPGSFPLAHGVQRRTHKLRAYGNAIVPQVAAEFVQAFAEGT